MTGAVCDRLDRAVDALGGINDLLASVTSGNLHQVDPGNLHALLELVRTRIDEARTGADAGPGRS